MPNDGAWHHLAVVRQGNLFSIYVDGQLAGSESADINIPNPSAPLTIGQAEQIGFVRGRLDEIAMYSRALVPDEIRAIYEAGAEGKCAGGTSGQPTGLVLARSGPCPRSGPGLIRARSRPADTGRHPFGCHTPSVRSRP